MRGRRKALTLLETVLAISVVLAVFYLLFRTQVRLRTGSERVLRHGSALKGLAAVRAQLAEDLACLLIPPRAPYGASGIRLRNQGRTLSFRRSSPEEAPQDGDLSQFREERVSWQFEPAASGPGTLIRRSTREDPMRFADLPVLSFRARIFRGRPADSREFLGIDCVAGVDRPGAEPGAAPSKLPLRLVRSLERPSVFRGWARSLPPTLVKFPDPTQSGPPPSLLSPDGSVTDFFDFEEGP